MATPSRNFSNNFCYHVYNCGVERRATFLTVGDYQRFLSVTSYYFFAQKIPYSQFVILDPEAQKEYLQWTIKEPEKQRVKLLAYCLMPNHFHFLLKQEREGGIGSFVSDISNSYTKYFNTKNKRLGHLYQGTFKAKEISNQESLSQVSRYIHLNPRTSSRVAWKGDLGLYPYSSYNNWVKELDDEIVQVGTIRKFIDLNGRQYKEFVRAKVGLNPAAGIENLVLETEL